MKNSPLYSLKKIGPLNTEAYRLAADPDLVDILCEIEAKITELIDAHNATLKDQGEDVCAWCGGGVEHYADCRMNKPTPDPFERIEKWVNEKIESIDAVLDDGERKREWVDGNLHGKREGLSQLLDIVREEKEAGV